MEIMEGTVNIIKIIKDRQAYEYIVEKSQITDQDLTGLIDNSNLTHQLILSTCYPIGFYNKRFNIVASPSSS